MHRSESEPRHERRSSLGRSTVCKDVGMALADMASARKPSYSSKSPPNINHHSQTRLHVTTVTELRQDTIAWLTSNLISSPQPQHDLPKTHPPIAPETWLGLLKAWGAPVEGIGLRFRSIGVRNPSPRTPPNTPGNMGSRDTVQPGNLMSLLSAEATPALKPALPLPGPALKPPS